MLEHVGKIKEILSWLPSLSVLIAHGDVFLTKLEKNWDSKHLQNKYSINYSPILIKYSIDQIPKKIIVKKEGNSTTFALCSLRTFDKRGSRSDIKQIFIYRILVPCTGWPKSKFAISNGYTSINMHFWPHVGKAKMCFGGLHLFSFFSCLFTIFKNKWRPQKHILALPTWGHKCIFIKL